jgi:uncharacterized protein (DUF305 family)
VAVLVAAAVSGAVGYSMGRFSSLFADVPNSQSVEAGFARDMQRHHDQGVELAMLIYGKTEDSRLRLAAYDIATAQAQQSGQMYGWLSIWGVPQYSDRPSMAWMAGHGEHDASSGDMPGLATADQVDELRAARGVTADRLFLELMIDHHRGAIDMATAVLTLSDEPSVMALATAVVRSQDAEIELLEGMLAELPAG